MPTENMEDGEKFASTPEEKADIKDSTGFTDGADGATLYLEQQKFDFESIRIQMILAAILFLSIALINYSPYFSTALHPPLVGAVTHSSMIYPWTIELFAIKRGLWHSIFHTANAGPQIIDVFFISTAAFLITLINLELTGLTGNRLKATPGIWAGLLFVVFPLHINLMMNFAGRADIFASTMYLASVAFFLRFQLLKERMYAIISAITGVLCLVTQLSVWSLPVVLIAAYFLVRPVDPNQPRTSAVIGASESGPSKSLFQNFNWRVIAFLLIWLGISFFASGIGVNLDYLNLNSLSLVPSAPFCILLANFLLFSFSVNKRQTTRAFAALGCAMLSAMVILWSIALKTNFSIMTAFPAAHFTP